jgi:hypothetical protein
VNYWEERGLYHRRMIDQHYKWMQEHTRGYKLWLRFARLDQQKVLLFRRWKERLRIYKLQCKYAKVIYRNYKMRFAQKNRFPFWQVYSHKDYKNGTILSENDAKKLNLKYEVLEGFFLLNRPKGNYVYPWSPFLSNLGQATRFLSYIPERKKLGQERKETYHTVDSKIRPFERIYKKKPRGNDKKKNLERIVLIEAANRFEFAQLHSRIMKQIP